MKVLECLTLSSLVDHIFRWRSKVFNIHWLIFSYARKTKNFISKQGMLLLSRRNIRRLSGVPTSHCCLNKHLHTIRYTQYGLGLNSIAGSMRKIPTVVKHRASAEHLHSIGSLIRTFQLGTNEYRIHHCRLLTQQRGVVASSLLPPFSSLLSLGRYVSVLQAKLVDSQRALEMFAGTNFKSSIAIDWVALQSLTTNNNVNLIQDHEHCGVPDNETA